MNKFDIAAKFSLYSFVSLLAMGTVVVNLSPNEGTITFQIVQAMTIALVLLVIFPGVYLWLTGFKRFSNYLGSWGPRMVMYICFTIAYAVYIQLKFGGKLEGS